ncbi:MAG: T9SS type A sorting domain-containing protein [Candidatus Cloacimonadota bacterium]|nr:MAG: T9SS type A sorting domain-containing protein [Candidatus Cloacimonadota bacterium]
MGFILSLCLMFSTLSILVEAKENDVITLLTKPTIKSVTRKLLVDQKPIFDKSGRSDLLFDQAATGYYGFYPCMEGSGRICDNFNVLYDANVDSAVWWGGYWNGTPTPPYYFWIEIYPDSIGFNQPQQNPIYTETISYYNETNLGGYYLYEAVIPPFIAVTGETYWIQFMATLIFPPQWGNNGSWPGNTPGWGDGQECFFKSVGYPLWTPATTVWGDPVETSFQIYGTSVGVAEEPGKTKTFIFGLSQNVPNPVREGKTTIPYSTTREVSVTLKIYDSTGRLVKTLIERQNESAGLKTVYWDCKDKNHHPVPAGVYFYKLATEDRTVTKKLVVVK